MRKLLSLTAIATAAILAASATGVQAAVEIDFNNPTGNLGGSHTYSNGDLSVTAYGITYGVDGVLNSTDLYGKNDGGDENGLGIANDPSGNHEIWLDETGAGVIFLNVSDLLGATRAQFFMGSTTNGEEWAVGGLVSGPPVIGSVISGSDELTWHDLPDWGHYDEYVFFVGNGRDYPRVGDNVLLGGLLLTSVPEPATWAMMLLGFASTGLVLRRNRKTVRRSAAPS